MSNLYAQVFAKLYDKSVQKAEEKALADRRRALLSGLKGNILEVGAGTGVNFQFYAKDANVLAIEPSPYMLRQAKGKKKDKENIRMLQASVETCFENEVIPKNSLNAVVCTLVLCTIPDPQQALSYFHHWLLPNGKLIVLEHIQSHVSWKAKVQDMVTPAWKIIGEGCHLNRKTDQMIRQSGFQAIEEDYFSYKVQWYQGVFRKIEEKNGRKWNK